MKRILCLGDSNTFGFDPRDFLGSRYPAGVRWTGRLQGMGAEVCNMGQNGLSIPNEAQLPVLADTLRRGEAFDVVTVMLGSNDLLGGATPEETAARMEPLLRCIAENAEGARVVLIAPPPMQSGEWVAESALLDASARLGGLYRALAEKLGVTFADAGGWGVSLTFDGVHFSPEGHEAFAKGLAAIVF
ncbi:MAG: lipase [Ruminococcaceae bacterium]|nr:lipase [Oscillospiraceae bacterium]